MTLDRQYLKNEAGLNNKFVVGVFGTNCNRKQQPRIMKAFSQLRVQAKALNLILYMHCQTKDDFGLGGWNLKKISQRLHIDDSTIFPHYSFDNVAGVPYTGTNDVEHEPKTQLCTFEKFNYIERLNCCDIIINVPHCGGFEMCVIEAQACGVPIAITNDSGIMAEVAGDAALLLPPSKGVVSRTGAHQFFVSPATIANAITYLRENPSVRLNISEKGIENAKKYPWYKQGQDILNVIEKLYFEF